MKSFAIVIHPLNIGQVKNSFAVLRILPDFILKKLLEIIPPFKFSQIKGMCLEDGREIEGYLIMCPILPEQLQSLSKKFVINKIASAVGIAEKLNASIIGLGGYTCLMTNMGEEISKKTKIPVTCGSVFAAWSIFEGIYRMSRIKKMDLKKATLAIIGTNSPVVSLCSRKFSEYVKKIIIAVDGNNSLEELKQNIQNLNSIEVVIEKDMRRAVKDADVAVLIPSINGFSFDLGELKRGAILCDFSILSPFRDKAELRPDVTIIEGGLVKLPFEADYGIDNGMPKNITFACMAEIMLLTFEERFVNYSLGENINLDKLEEIADIAVRNNFEVWLPEAPVL